VNSDNGNIVFLNSAGQLGGSLFFIAPNVWITSQSILSQLEADPNFAGRDAALANNSGQPNPLGFVGANGITVIPGSTFFVQNSGTANDMGGITAGDRGLFIENANGLDPATGLQKPVAVTIYGRQVKSDGTTI